MNETPFKRTHYRRTDGLRAMLLFIANGTAVFRVSFGAGRGATDRITSTTEGYFNRTFAEAA